MELKTKYNIGQTVIIDDWGEITEAEIQCINVHIDETGNIDDEFYTVLTEYGFREQFDLYRIQGVKGPSEPHKADKGPLITDDKELSTLFYMNQIGIPITYLDLVQIFKENYKEINTVQATIYLERLELKCLVNSFITADENCSYGYTRYWKLVEEGIHYVKKYISRNE